MPKQIAFIAYETSFAPAGGIAAVMGRLAEGVRKASGLPTLVVTPFHFKIPKTAAIAARAERLGQILVPFEDQAIPVQLLRLEKDGSWCFLHAEDKRFFAGVRHPYDLPPADLLRDALFFGAATARALPLIAPEADWTVMLQDWEAATAALALSQNGAAHFDIFLTLHNSYDSGVTDAELRRFGLDPAACPGDTILLRALPLVRQPVFTVSDQFALDFSEEILQAEVMAPHLSEILPRKLIGIPNGPFADLAVDSDALNAARRGDFSALHRWKAANRENFLRALDDFQPSTEKPVWGDLRKFQRDAVPSFVLAGRDDPRQKGYDVACRAIADFLAGGGHGQFLFFPIPGDEGLEGLAFLQRLTQAFPESVLALPFIFKEGFFAALQGASFGVMPSFYEPFGMANEFYLNGTMGIGRATGGILQQIVPLRACASFSHAVQRRVGRYFGAAAHPTGILYRERDGLPSAADDWRGINAAEYQKGEDRPDRVEQRQVYPLFRAMTAELRLALQDATRLYCEQPDLYDRMLVAGIDHILNSFSWERAAQAYVRYQLN